MRNITLILFGTLCASASMTAMATPAQYAIGIERVAGAVGNAGIEVSPGEVTMLTDAVASTPAPTLTVRSVERWNNNRMLVRLECELRQECVPFFVVVGRSAGVSADRAMSQGSVPYRAVGAGRNSSVVFSGAPATLLLEDERVHIRIPVICLENGALGQTIRVRGKENRLIYSAQVLSGALVKGKL